MSELDFELDLDALQLLDGNEAHLMIVRCTTSCLTTCEESCQTTCKVTDFP